MTSHRTLCEACVSCGLLWHLIPKPNSKVLKVLHTYLFLAYACTITTHALNQIESVRRERPITSASQQCHTNLMSDALSEKAKGKRRAVDADDEAASVSVTSNAPDISKESNRTFTVRFSEGVPDLEMTVGPSDTVREVQRRVSIML